MVSDHSPRQFEESFFYSPPIFKSEGLLWRTLPVANLPCKKVNELIIAQQKCQSIQCCEEAVWKTNNNTKILEILKDNLHVLFLSCKIKFYQINEFICDFFLYLKPQLASRIIYRHS